MLKHKKIYLSSADVIDKLLCKLYTYNTPATTSESIMDTVGPELCPLIIGGLLSFDVESIDS